MLSSSRLLKLLPVLVFLALAVPNAAFGQATRTWVSGVGDDVNPCSRTAPCKTFAGAISKTAPGGEINCLDPGGFGAVTITKSLSIKCRYTEGGILAALVNGVIINAASTDTVTLDGLDINGAGTGAQTALVGVKVMSAAKVNIRDSEIFRMQNGVAVVPGVAGSTTRVVITNSHIHDNVTGVFNGAVNNTVNASVVTIRNSDIQANTCGVSTSGFGSNSGTNPNGNVDCGAAGSGSGIAKTAATSIYHSGVNANGTGVFVRGAFGVAEIGNDEITGNSVFGLHRVDSGVIRTTSPATNVVSDNAASDAPNATTTLQKRHGKKRFSAKRART
jgi:hypothetical protein